MAKNCGNCKFREAESYEEPCSSCGCTSSGTPTKWVSQHELQTNADRIRAMTDEELVNFLSNWGGCNKCKFRDTCTSSIGSVSKICKEIHLEWLKQPAEGE